MYRYRERLYIKIGTGFADFDYKNLYIPSLVLSLNPGFHRKEIPLHRCVVEETIIEVHKLVKRTLKKYNQKIILPIEIKKIWYAGSSREISDGMFQGFHVCGYSVGSWVLTRPDDYDLNEFITGKKYFLKVGLTDV